jgi:hypothetical protein
MNPSMPAKGSSVFTPFSGILPDGKGETVNAGIPLFELVCIGAPTGTQLFGFHDVEVKIKKKERDLNFGLEYDIQWHRGIGREREYSKYEYDKVTGRSYAFVPDDPAWHNVLRLAETIDSGKYAISQYFVPGGVISGAVKTEEMRFIAECIFDHSVTSKGIVLFRSKNLDEAMAFEQEQKSKGVQCQTVHSKIPELEALVRKYGVLWNHQPAFQDGIRKDIEAQIKAKFYPDAQIIQQQADPVAIVEKAIEAMDSQQFISLFQKKMAQPAPAPASATKAPEAKKPIVLENIAMPQLKELAEDMGIFTKGMQREDIIKAIREKQAEDAAPAPAQQYPGPQEEQVFK